MAVKGNIVKKIKSIQSFTFNGENADNTFRADETGIGINKMLIPSLWTAGEQYLKGDLVFSAVSDSIKLFKAENDVLSETPPAEDTANWKDYTLQFFCNLAQKAISDGNGDNISETYVKKITGKALSSNDFTDTYKSWLDDNKYKTLKFVTCEDDSAVAKLIYDTHSFFRVLCNETGENFFLLQTLEERSVSEDGKIKTESYLQFKISENGLLYRGVGERTEPGGSGTLQYSEWESFYPTEEEITEIYVAKAELGSNTQSLTENSLALNEETVAGQRGFRLATNSSKKVTDEIYNPTDELCTFRLTKTSATKEELEKLKASIGEGNTTLGSYAVNGTPCYDVLKVSYDDIDVDNYTITAILNRLNLYGSGQDYTKHPTSENFNSYSNNSTHRYAFAIWFSDYPAIGTRDVGTRAVAFNRNTQALEDCAFAANRNTKASRCYSAAFGSGTVAGQEAQFVRGKYNVIHKAVREKRDADGNRIYPPQYLDIVGNGSSDTSRSDAYKLDSEGNGYFAGNVYANDNDKLVTETDLQGRYYESLGIYTNYDNSFKNKEFVSKQTYDIALEKTIPTPVQYSVVNFKMYSENSFELAIGGIEDVLCGDGTNFNIDLTIITDTTQAYRIVAHNPTITPRENHVLVSLDENAEYYCITYSRDLEKYYGYKIESGGRAEILSALKALCETEGISIYDKVLTLDSTTVRLQYPDSTERTGYITDCISIWKYIDVHKGDTIIFDGTQWNILNVNAKYITKEEVSDTYATKSETVRVYAAGAEYKENDIYLMDSSLSVGANKSPVYSLHLVGARETEGVYVAGAYMAERDIMGNKIIDTYATKEDVSDAYATIALMNELQSQIAQAVKPEYLTNISYLFSEGANPGLYATLDTSYAIAADYTFRKNPNENISFRADNCQGMQHCFESSSAVTVDFLNGTPKLETANHIFNKCASLTGVTGLDCTNVTTLKYAFSGCTALTSIDLVSTANVTDLSYVFYNSGLTEITGLNTSKVTNLDGAFAKSKVTDLQLDCTNVTSAKGTFTDCTSLSSLTISNAQAEIVSTLFSSLPECESGAITLTNCTDVTDEIKLTATEKGWTVNEQ